MIPGPDLAPALAEVRRLAGETPFDLAAVLGSGLGALTEQVEGAVSFAYPELFCFPPAAVAGHAGRLVTGTLNGRRVLLFAGRYHLYEGYSAFQVTLPVRLAHLLGCRRLLLTNAAGGINPAYAPGDFLFIADHLNLLGDNPLRGFRDEPFLDLSHLYRTDLHPPLLEFARHEGIPLHFGILAALPGPSYETPAEIRMLRLLGADAVSMSTVPEAIMGKYLGMEITGLSMIANQAAGLAPALHHTDVLSVARAASGRFSTLVRGLMGVWPPGPETASGSNE